MSDSRVCLAGLLIGSIIVWLVRFEKGASTGVSWVDMLTSYNLMRDFCPKLQEDLGLLNSKPCFRIADPFLPAADFGIKSFTIVSMDIQGCSNTRSLTHKGIDLRGQERH